MGVSCILNKQVRLGVIEVILGQRHEGHEEVKHADIRVEENPRQKKHPIRPGNSKAASVADRGSEIGDEMTEVSGYQMHMV